jgi:hypothetical protein
MGFREPVRRSTLADANERRDWRIYAEVAQRLIVHDLKGSEPFLSAVAQAPPQPDTSQLRPSSKSHGRLPVNQILIIIRN